MTELKPCPFCGCYDLQNYATMGSHEPIIDDVGSKWVVMCNDCGATIGEGDSDLSKENVVNAWNRRSSGK